MVARRRSCSPKWTRAETRTSLAVSKAGDEVGRAPAPRTADLVASHDGDPSIDARAPLEGRYADRRSGLRATPERRSTDRRRAKLRGLLFSALALFLPHHRLSLPRVMSASPRVSTSVNSFVAVPPQHAYDAIIREASRLYKVDAALIRSVVQAESAFDPLALSRVGAMGLMQLMPSTAEALDVDNPFDPRENIMAGTRLLKDLLTRRQRRAHARQLQRRAGERRPTAAACRRSRRRGTTSSASPVSSPTPQSGETDSGATAFSSRPSTDGRRL